MKVFIKFNENDGLFYLTDTDGTILDKDKSIRFLTEKAHINGVKRVEFSINRGNRK